MRVAVTVVLTVEAHDEKWAQRHAELILVRLLDSMITDYSVVEACEIKDGKE